MSSFTDHRNAQALREAGNDPHTLRPPKPTPTRQRPEITQAALNDFVQAIKGSKPTHR